ncbi:MAG: MFS transporter [Bacteroidales bacterium]|nr:MFS transporter [Bacteroidales bacterium]MDD5974772.1 MFS transporter [Bacteroidales bacterium]MDY5194479.1 MFS transporter [Candidatus Aphodosoma sp.]
MKNKLIIMNFLQFAIWGAYLTSMGQYLGRVEMGNEIAWFYAIQGIVSIFMPTVMGIVADKYIQPQRLLGLCHLLSGVAMISLCLIGYFNEIPDKTLFITIYTIGVAFYMPTLALSNTTAFNILKNHNYDTVKDFPPIRVFGTVGFIATMWFVNCATLDGGRFFMTFAENSNKFQYTYMQFGVSGVLGILMFFYSFILPHCEISEHKNTSIVDALGLSAFKLFKTKQMAVFFIFSMLLGMSLQITNGYATPYITSFKGIEELSNTFAANNATLLISISQISEALCILLIPFFLKKFGIKVVMLIAMFAWVVRFGCFAIGDPAFPGVLLLIVSCIVYGVAFDFFNVSGGLFVDQECPEEYKASGQGLFMLMTNGLGATIGTLAAGKVINAFCHWQDGYLLGNWTYAWLIFSGFAFVVAVLFAFLFKYKHNPQ